MTALEILKTMIAQLQADAKAGKISLAEYVIAASMLLIADDLDAIRKSLSAAAPAKK